MQIQTTAEDHRIAWLAALAITIHILESALPSPVPGLKPGLANVITIAALIQFGWGTAAWVSLLRVLLSSAWVVRYAASVYCGLPAGFRARDLARSVTVYWPRWPTWPDNSLSPFSFSYRTWHSGGCSRY
jgi:riboflavin transporter FmnP